MFDFTIRERYIIIIYTRGVFFFLFTRNCRQSRESWVRVFLFFFVRANLILTLTALSSSSSSAWYKNENLEKEIAFCSPLVYIYKPDLKNVHLYNGDDDDDARISITIICGACCSVDTCKCSVTARDRKRDQKGFFSRFQKGNTFFTKQRREKVVSVAAVKPTFVVVGFFP